MALLTYLSGGADAPCSALAIWRRPATAFAALLVVLLLFCSLAVPFDCALGQGANDRPVLLVNIKGAIGFVAAGQLVKAVEQAEAQGSTPAVIVRIDTPGGLLTSTREMIHTILASRVPIIMYVAPSGSRAASAGTYLMYAAHVAAMAPGTHLGAATPISLSPLVYRARRRRRSPRPTPKRSPSRTHRLPQRERASTMP